MYACHFFFYSPSLSIFLVLLLIIEEEEIGQTEVVVAEELVEVAALLLGVHPRHQMLQKTSHISTIQGGLCEISTIFEADYVKFRPFLRRIV